jgi:hypothetical protein
VKDLTYITEHHFDARWRSKAAAVNAISSQLEKMIAVFEQLDGTLTETLYIHVQFPKRNCG